MNQFTTKAQNNPFASRWQNSNTSHQFQEEAFATNKVGASPSLFKMESTPVLTSFSYSPTGLRTPPSSSSNFPVVYSPFAQDAAAPMSSFFPEPASSTFKPFASISFQSPQQQPVVPKIVDVAQPTPVQEARAKPVAQTSTSTSAPQPPSMMSGWAIEGVPSKRTEKTQELKQGIQPFARNRMHDMQEEKEEEKSGAVDIFAVKGNPKKVQERTKLAKKMKGKVGTLIPRSRYKCGGRRADSLLLLKSMVTKEDVVGRTEIFTEQMLVPRKKD